jgi:N-acyl-D-amino-acid deacylase
MYDLIIKNGTVLDGTGSDGITTDIAIKDGKIAFIGSCLDDGKEIIDARGLTVSPGFIDSHSHSDESVLQFPEQIEKVEQGITTSITGQCGISAAPSEQFKTVGEFINALETVSMGANMKTFIGHGALRGAVVGSVNRKPTEAELKQMGELLKEGIYSGALGVSFGLIYAPGCFAETDEIVYLAKVCKEAGGMIAAHIRDEGYKLKEAVEEFLHVIRISGARAVFSHHKAMFKENWGLVNTTLKMIDDAINEGYDIYLDMYPYTASRTSVAARFVPKEYHSGGVEKLTERLSDPACREEIKKINRAKFGADDDLSWTLITNCENTNAYDGLRINEIAQKLNKDVYDTVFDIIIESKGTAQACYFLMNEDDLKTVLKHERCMICTDSDVRGAKNAYHPRLRASFTRAIARYVREEQTVSLAEMIRKMTSLPASVYGLKNKGVIKEGFDADLCVFDFEKIKDRSDYTSCHLRAEGLNYVIVNGKITVKDATYLGVKAGGYVR